MPGLFVFHPIQANRPVHQAHYGRARCTVTSLSSRWTADPGYRWTRSEALHFGRLVGHAQATKTGELLHNNVWLACTGHGAARDLQIGHQLRSAAYGSSSSTDGTPDYCIACVDTVGGYALMEAMLSMCSDPDSPGIITSTEGYAEEMLRSFQVYLSRVKSSCFSMPHRCELESLQSELRAALYHFSTRLPRFKT